MDIITGKDAGTWQDGVYMVDGVEEYIVDFLEPTQEFSAATFKAQAEHAIEKLTAQGKVPVIVGGTGLYISALVDNYTFSAPQGDQQVRKMLEQRLGEEGLDSLYAELHENDPAYAQTISSQDTHRILRRLEVLEIGLDTEAHTQEPDYEFLLLMPDWPREVLYNRIETRIDSMLASGGWEEVKYIMHKYGENLNATSSIGYAQLAQALSGELSEHEAIELFKRDSRRYAKRQLTWFGRYNEKIHKIDLTDFPNNLNTQIITDFLT
jgi:tRNA dimethylallyltransferase